VIFRENSKKEIFFTCKFFYKIYRKNI